LRECAVGNVQKTYAFCSIGFRLGKRLLVGLQAIDQRQAAASSEPELIFDPEDNWFSTLDKLVLVLLRLFSA